MSLSSMGTSEDSHTGILVADLKSSEKYHTLSNYQKGKRPLVPDVEIDKSGWLTHQQARSMDAHSESEYGDCSIG